MILPRTFYERPTLDVAGDLIGKVLVRRDRGRTTSGIIVETEAYIGESDPACHAAPGPTPRNAPLYGRPGVAYVYFNYGMHYLVNAVTERQGSPAAVLIRALDPIEGIPAMRRRRFPHDSGRGSTVAVAGLCKGPGNLTRALGISATDNRRDLVTGILVIEDRGHHFDTVAWGPRIGIRVGVDRPWRVYVPDHPAVSGPRRLRMAMITVRLKPDTTKD